jgi:hypothetical protein
LLDSKLTEVASVKVLLVNNLPLGSSKEAKFKLDVKVFSNVLTVEVDTKEINELGRL